jgi:hypothetical protein
MACGVWLARLSALPTGIPLRGVREAITTYSWTSVGSADWNTAADSSPAGGPPDAATAVAVIAAAGSYSVSIAGGESETVHSVTLNHAGATLSVAGTLTLTGARGTLAVTAGVLDLTGTIEGGTINDAGDGLAFNDGTGNPTLKGVTYQGTLTLANEYAFVTGGLTMETAAGGKPGSIDLMAGNAGLWVLDRETLNNAVLNFGTAGGDYLSDPSNSGTTLTLGSGFTHPTNAFATSHRMTNWHACNGCWNDPWLRFDHEDFLWYPRHAGTRLITADQVKQTIERIPGVLRESIASDDIARASPPTGRKR